VRVGPVGVGWCMWGGALDFDHGAEWREWEARETHGMCMCVCG
jgi:hypothetical protein